MGDKSTGGFLLNCFKKNNLAVQESNEVSGFGINNIKDRLKSNKFKWVDIGVGVYIVTTKLGLIGMLTGKGKKWEKQSMVWY